MMMFTSMDWENEAEKKQNSLSLIIYYYIIIKMMVIYLTAYVFQQTSDQ